MIAIKWQKNDQYSNKAPRTPNFVRINRRTILQSHQQHTMLVFDIKSSDRIA